MDRDQVVGWPGGHRAALIVSIDIDSEYGVINDHGLENWFWRSQARYDLEAGIWRLLSIFDDYDVNATFCWVGRAAEDRPDAVLAARAAGHEIATHGWDHRIYAGMTPDEQRTDLTRTRALLQQITGEEPVGHKTPSWKFNDQTATILQDLGFLWNMDIASADLPYLMRPDPGKPPLVQLPPSRLWEDYAFFVDSLLSSNQVFDTWREDIDVLRAEGKLMCLTCHPWIIGRPAPSRALTMLLDYVIGLGDVWITRADHLAQWWRDQNEPALSP